MKILVTGAAGFIGMHTCERLLDGGHEVVGLDNLNDYYDPALKRARLHRIEGRAGFRAVVGDICDLPALARLFEDGGFQRVIHLAAQPGVRYSITHPHAYAQANLVGFLNVLEACRHHGLPHLVYASSSSVYGGNVRLPYSEHHAADHPVSLYAATKRANELMAHSYSHLYGLPATGLRFFTVYGPWGRPDMSPMLFTRAILEGRPIDVFNEGRMRRDFTYVDDIVEGVVRIMDRQPVADPGFDPLRPDPATAAVPWRLYNIGNHEPVDLLRFIAILERLLGRTARKRLLPMQPGDVEATCADVEDLQRDADFAPRTPLEQGLARFVDWYRGFYGA